LTVRILFGLKKAGGLARVIADFLGRYLLPTEP
jgi:hypothetical protein